MLHHHHTPEYLARGSFVGLFIAFTPTVGFQIVMVLAVWAAVRALRPAWTFSPTLAVAWTFTSNVVTVPPIYYAFYVTGRLALGRWSEARGFDAFVAQFENAMGSGGGWLTAMWRDLIGLFDVFGTPMIVGCVPWAILFGVIGYVWTARFVTRRRGVRAARRLAAQMTLQAPKSDDPTSRRP